MEQPVRPPSPKKGFAIGLTVILLVVVAVIAMLGIALFEHNDRPGIDPLAPGVDHPMP